MDGSLTLMPGIVSFAPGDTIVELNSDAGKFLGGKFSAVAANPFAYDLGLSVSVNGSAAQGGGNSPSQPTVITARNDEPDSFYFDSGGTVSPPSVFSYAGAYFNGVEFNEGPVNINAARGAFWVGGTTNQMANPIYTYNLLATQNNGTGTYNSLAVNPYLNDWTLYANGQLGLGGGNANVHFNTNSDGITFNDKITGAAIGRVTGVTVTQGPGAGSLADGTYCYTVYGRNYSGTGPVSSSVCQAVSNRNANTVKISWNRLRGVTYGGYYICGRPSNSGGELLLTNVSPSQLYWIDNGSLSPGAACPTTDTSLPFIDNVASVNFNSSGTANKVTLKAAAGAAGSTAVTLPSITGTLPVLVAGGTATMTTAAIASGACGATVSPGATSGTLTNVLSTDSIKWSYNAAIGANPAGLLIVNQWVSAGAVGFAYCNPGGGSITPKAATINWQVTR
jgi:hypothetical protein